MTTETRVQSAFHDVASNRPISVYRLGEMPIQSRGQSVSAPRGNAGARLNAHTELRAKRQRSAREMIYRNLPIIYLPGPTTREYEASSRLSRPTAGASSCQGLADSTRHVIDTRFEPSFLELNGIFMTWRRRAMSARPHLRALLLRAQRRSAGLRVGPGMYFSPRHRLAFNSRNEGSKCVGRLDDGRAICQ